MPSVVGTGAMGKVTRIPKVPLEGLRRGGPQGALRMGGAHADGAGVLLPLEHDRAGPRRGGRPPWGVCAREIAEPRCRTDGTRPGGDGGPALWSRGAGAVGPLCPGAL